MTLARLNQLTLNEQTEQAARQQPSASLDAVPLNLSAPIHIGWLERAIGLMTVITAVAWAAWPLQLEVLLSVSKNAEPHPPAGLVADITPLDYAAFHIPLWKISPPLIALEPVVAPPTPTPIKLQLLAIVREEGTYAAMCYDPNGDTLLVLHEGDSTGGRKVERITGQQLDLRDERGLVTLSIQENTSSGGGGT